MKTTRSARLFARALQILPGGVDSPVRAFKSVGASPLFITRASGARLDDVDGNTFIDYVMSWGPLIHGHAPRGMVKALAAAARLGHELRRAQPSRGRARRTGTAPDALARTRALRQLGHRSRHERDPGGPGGHRAREDHQVRRVLPRPRRLVSRAGRVRRADARRADQPRRDARRPRTTPCSQATTTSRRCTGCSTPTAARSRRSSSSRSPATWGWCRRPMAFCGRCATSATPTARCSSSTR